VISLLIFGCMVYACNSMVMCCNRYGDLPGLTMILALPFHFLDSHGVVGYPTCFC